MGFISGLAALLVFVVFCVMIAALIKPSWLKNPNKPDEVIKRTEILVGGVIAIIILTIISAITSPEPTPESAQKNVPDSAVKVTTDDKSIVMEPTDNNKKEVTQPVKVEANLGMTPEQFRKKFNARLNELNISGFRPFGEFNIETGSVRDSFQIEISDDIAMTGSVNKDGMLRGITYIVIAKNDATKATLDLLTLAGITSNVVTNDNDKNKTKANTFELIEAALNSIDKDENMKTKVVGNVEFFASASRITGLWFGVEPAKDE